MLQPYFKCLARLQPISFIEIFIGYLHLAEILKITKERLKKESEIYGFICKSNNKLYIGSSKNLSDRFSQHLSDRFSQHLYDRFSQHTKEFKSNILFQNAINKYNLQDFILIVFEYCKAEDLISREQFYIDALNPEYNILKVAGSSLGYKHTNETLVKMSEAWLGKNNSMLGRTG